MITLYTPATGFPDLEVKIAYGLARVGVEAFGIDRITICNHGGFYTVIAEVDESNYDRLERTFDLLCKRLLSSSYIPFNTPGIGGRSAESIPVFENEILSLEDFKSMPVNAANKKSENICRHRSNPVGNIIGFAASTSYHHKRDGIDISIQQNIPRRPTNPKNICKVCALLALLGMWYASFIFSVADKEVIVIPIPNQELTGYKLQEIFALQHKVRKQWLNQNIPQILIPLVFLSKIPSSADILEGFDLFIAVLSRQQGYHVDGIFLIEIEHYLDYIRQTSFNIATIDRLLINEAYKALNELNNSIYYRKADSLLKFARLYVQETSTNNWTNLLFLDTANYLLKEVGMLPSNIIENPSLQSLARTLRYFIRERKYGYADDIRNSRKGSRDFEETIAKMLREGELRRVQQEQERNAGKEVKSWIYLPKEEEIKEVFQLANEDFESTKLALVILAFSFPSKVEEITE
uniref:Type I-A CRISPR-associated protein Csa5 n=1 Tax=candidate division WOR-3 bacterium TaxID=2052148 RepID=A0A7C3NAX1_UNCW3